MYGNNSVSYIHNGSKSIAIQTIETIDVDNFLGRQGDLDETLVNLKKVIDDTKERYLGKEVEVYCGDTKHKVRFTRIFFEYTKVYDYDSEDYRLLLKGERAFLPSEVAEFEKQKKVNDAAREKRERAEFERLSKLYGKT